MKTESFTSLFALCMLASCSVSEKNKLESRPNVVFILADDLGYGDVSCYGQEKFTTPNIDALASEGMKFTQFYAGCTVSAPSRCSLMTGFHTGHAQVRGNRELKGEGQLPMAEGTYTIARMFKDNGYATGAFGKWGLGFPGSEGDPNNQGFDEFFGYNCQRQAHRYYPSHLWHNQEKVILEGNDTKNKTVYAPDLIHEKALDFIRTNKDKPFFAFIPVIQPHAELLVPEDSIIEKYRGKYPETPFVADKEGAEYGDPDFDVKAYCSQPEPHATFAAMVSRVDKYVGDVTGLLKELGIDDNTIVIFSSDNGPHLEGGADPDFWNSNGDFSGYKRSMTDGGIRVPMIIKWGDRIKAGSVEQHIGAFYDFMPTFADLLGVDVDKTDGISLLPVITGSGEQKAHEFLYWEHQGNVAIRMGDWKAIRTGLLKDKDTPLKLYNISSDVAEVNDVAALNPEIAAKAMEIMKREHTVNHNYPLYASERKK